MDSFQNRNKVELARSESMIQCATVLFMAGMVFFFGLFLLRRRSGDILAYMAQHRWYSECKQLVKLGFGVKQPAKEGKTALNVLMRNYDKYHNNWAKELVVDLLKRGADPNIVWQGKTPIFTAVAYYDLELVKAFIEAGADVKVKDSAGRTILFQLDNHRKAYRRHKGSKRDFENKTIQLLDLLINKGVSANEPDNKGRAVISYLPSVTAVKKLIALGADVRAIDKSGGNVLHNCRHTEVIKFLADKGIDVNQQDKLGRTPLHLRMAEKHTGSYVKVHFIAKALLRAGSNVDVKDQEGYSPFHLAIKSGKTKCAQLLLAKSADTQRQVLSGKLQGKLSEVVKVNPTLWESLGLEKKLKSANQLQKTIAALEKPFAEREKSQQKLQEEALLAYLEKNKANRDKLLTVKAANETIELVFVPAGTYQMGARKNDVTIKQPFLLGKTEITRGQWQAIMNKALPRDFGNNLPITNVSRQDAEQFCMQLARLTERSVRLPSEAEWEYACRAGSKGLFCFSDDTNPRKQELLLFHEQFVHGRGRGNIKPIAVASKRANAWGLYDMNGNASELCADHYRSSFAPIVATGRPYLLSKSTHPTFMKSVRRGGSYQTPIFRCTMNYRDSLKITRKAMDTGFRIAVELKPQNKETLEKEEHSPGALSVNGINMRLVWIPAGSFKMGSNEDPYHEEEPVHTVTIERGFWMGAFEVTQGQYKAITGLAKGPMKDDKLPVTELSWAEARNFCNSLTRREQSKGLLKKDLAYRLPSEAEWEYACKASTTGQTYGQLEKIAWCGSPDKATIHPGGLKEPNAWGLYDMLGNVAEWCQDIQHGDYKGAPSDGSAWLDGKSKSRIVRGGMDNTIKSRCRASHRSGRLASDRHYAIGFRVVLDRTQ